MLGNEYVPQGGIRSVVDREQEWKTEKEKSSEMDWVHWGPDVL